MLLCFILQGASYSVSGNGPLVEAVTKWTLKEEGVLRVLNVSHNKASAS